MNKVRMSDMFTGPKDSRFKDPPEGLDGYWWEDDKMVCVPLIENENEGDGTFSKWLTELESKRKIVFFPTVISRRLDSILLKKGYTLGFIKSKEIEEDVFGLFKDCR